MDGVLNSIKGLKEAYNKDRRPYSGYDYPFDSSCLNNLKTLVEKTNAYLVITSTWRMHEIGKSILLNELKKYNLNIRVIGYTDILHKSRGEEIKAYLDKLDKDIKYIILDDDSDFLGLEDHLVKTNYEFGLTEQDTNEAVKKLVK